MLMVQLLIPTQYGHTATFSYLKRKTLSLKLRESSDDETNIALKQFSKWVVNVGDSEIPVILWKGKMNHLRLIYLMT